MAAQVKEEEEQQGRLFKGEGQKEEKEAFTPSKAAPVPPLCFQQMKSDLIG